MKHYDLLVIGGVAAGMSAASQARRVNPKMTIGVLEKGDYVSYGACGMPYYISGKIRDHSNLIAIDVEEYITKRKIEIMRRSEAVKVDFSAKRVSARGESGSEDFSYGRLVIATGARPFVPPIEGIRHERIFTLHDLSEGIAIRNFIEKNSPRSAALIGGGFIGLEMAGELTETGIRCTILEKMESVAMTLDPEVRGIIASRLADKGVEVLTGVDVKRIEPAGQGLRIHLADGKAVEADFAVVSVGVMPATEFLRTAGLAMTDRGAIIVNERSETNIEGVYAGGDCATVRHRITGANVYMPLATTANKQGRVAGLQAAGVSSEKFDGVVGSQLVKVFELEAGKTGLGKTDAANAGIPCEEVSASWHDLAGYYPGSESMLVKLFVDPRTRVLIGAQAVGVHGAALRTNIMATAITAGMTVDEFAYLDLGYAPPFAPVWDSLLVAAQKMVKR